MKTEVFVFPKRAMIEQWRGVLHHFVGLENDDQLGTGLRFNFILSNGARDGQRDAHVKQYYDHMLPADSHKRIR